MKKIICAGFHETGAGVIDNVFRECDNVCQGSYGAEVRFLHDPDGISDLEFHLVENPHRLSSAIAIKRFIKYAESQSRQISKVFGNGWRPFAKDFAESLALCKFKGYTNGDVLLLSDYQRNILFLKKGFNRLKPAKLRHPTWYNYLPNMITYYSRLDEDEFLNKVRDFTEDFAARVNNQDLEYVVLDQFVGVDNPARYLRYVKGDAFVYVVDRDPRDLYIHYQIRKDKVLPKDVKQFCVVYQSIREKTSPYPDNVLYLKFEDLITNYKTSVDNVLSFAGIGKEHHIYPGRYFDPIKSSEGIRLWERYPQFNDEVAYISKTLPDYLYSY